jgi:hypothetical protein
LASFAYCEADQQTGLFISGCETLPCASREKSTIVLGNEDGFIVIVVLGFAVVKVMEGFELESCTSRRSGVILHQLHAKGSSKIILDGDCRKSMPCEMKVNSSLVHVFKGFQAVSVTSHLTQHAIGMFIYLIDPLLFRLSDCLCSPLKSIIRQLHWVFVHPEMLAGQWDNPYFVLYMGITLGYISLVRPRALSTSTNQGFRSRGNADGTQSWQ